MLEYLLWETEQMHGRIRRYTSPDEHAFFPRDLPPLVLPPIQYSEASLTELRLPLTTTPPLVLPPIQYSEARLTELRRPLTTTQHSSRGAGSTSVRLDVCLALHKHARKGAKATV